MTKRSAGSGQAEDPSQASDPDPTRRSLALRLAGLAATGQALASPSMSIAADAPGETTGGASRLPSQPIPPPPTISPQAQRYLSAVSASLAPGAPRPPPPPALNDTAGWKALVAATDKMLEGRNTRLLAKARAKIASVRMGEGQVFVCTPDELAHPERARIHIHGGAWTISGGRGAMAEAADLATRSGCVAFGLDYRMPPDHPFPAALDDCVSAYREVIKTYAPKKVAISGGSSGGDLVAALCLKLRDLGLPLPGAAVMLSPVTDLAQTSDTWSTHMGIDPIVTRHTYANNALYTAGRDIADPLLSPRLGDFTKGFPPSFLQSGTRDILLSDTVLIHRALRKAGVEAELHVWEAMPHAGFGGDTPEDDEIQAEVLRFLDKHLA